MIWKKWKDKSRRKPLILTGVRQCGKTYIVDEFARSNFESYVYVNFESEETLSAIGFDVYTTTAKIELGFLVEAQVEVTVPRISFDWNW